MINAYRVLLTRARQRIAIVFFYLSALSNSNFLYICRSAFEVV